MWSEAEAWSSLRRRARLLWYLLFASLPGILVVSLLPLGGALRQSVLLPLVTFAFVAAIGVAGLRMQSFVCPRCRQRYFERWYFFKPLDSRCVNCGLERGSGAPQQG